MLYLSFLLNDYESVLRRCDFLIAKNFKVAELNFLKAYLPKSLSETELTKIVSDVISELKVDSMKEMGKVMKEALVRAKGAADNRALSQIIKNKLQNVN